MTNRIAIITGGSRGLGRNTAVNLARRGADIIFTYRTNQKEAESLIREVQATGRKAAGFVWRRVGATCAAVFEGRAEVKITHNSARLPACGPRLRWKRVSCGRPQTWTQARKYGLRAAH